MHIIDFIETIHMSVNNRLAFEASKGNDASSNKAKTIEKARKGFTQENVAQVLMNLNIDVHALFNRASNVSSRINVYTIERKSLNLAQVLANQGFLNVFTNHVVKLARAFHDASLVMTREDVLNGCDANHKEKDKDKAKVMVVFPKHETQGTISAQVSSSLDALCIFGVLTKSHNAQGRETYSLNTQNETTKAILEEIV